MKTSKTRRPKYRRQRRTGRNDLAFVELGGSRFYLGDHGTKESRQEYRRLLAEWEGGGRAAPVAQSEITVVEVTVRFLTHAEASYCRPDGTPTSELSLFKMAVQALILPPAIRKAMAAPSAMPLSIRPRTNGSAA